MRESDGGAWAADPGQRAVGDGGPRAPGAWLAAAEEGCGEVARERLSVEEQRAEFLLMGLRLREGVDWARLEGLELTIFKQYQRVG